MNIPPLRYLLLSLLLAVSLPIGGRYLWSSSQDRSVKLIPDNVIFRSATPRTDIDWVLDAELRLGDFWNYRVPRQGALINLGSFANSYEVDRDAWAHDSFEGPTGATYLELAHHVAPKSYVGHHFRMSPTAVSTQWASVQPTHLALLVRTDLKGVSNQFDLELKDQMQTHKMRVNAPIDTRWKWVLLPLNDFIPSVGDDFSSQELHELVILFHSDVVRQTIGTLQVARISLVNHLDWQPSLVEDPPFLVEQNRQSRLPPARPAVIDAPPTVADANNEWTLFDFSKVGEPGGEFGGEYGSWQSDGGKESSSNEVWRTTDRRRLALHYEVKPDLEVGHYFEIRGAILGRRLDAAPTHLRMRLRATRPCAARFKIGLKLGAHQYDFDVDGVKNAEHRLTGQWSTIDFALKDIDLDPKNLSKLSQIVTIFSGRTAAPPKGELELQRISVVAKPEN